ncbi:CCA tRNA nucleotidyltransferase [Halonotius sp. F2-221B]|uniref:CCA tRNA nucleotidyltransferase n=1 Tax=Halonotius sp. F2-221B TaxID=2731620 RepID=UPI00398A6047
MGMPSLDSVLDTVADRVTPDSDERERLAATAATLTDRAEAALADHDIDGDVLQVGSTARGTWLAGDRDIDLFVRFPTDYDRAELERLGLAIGHEVLPEGHEEYAEHPYVTGEFDGFAVDLVPCYAVDSATAIRSAVDRTPFHTRYIDDRLDDDLARDIRVFKQFLKGIEAYGSDLRTEGFSGYLAELLVVEYGGIEPLLRAAADWHPPITLDPEDHGEVRFDDPLTVIDPTDPERNVAAVLSATNLARLQHYARDLLADPREELFHPSEPAALDHEAVRTHLADRETTAAAIVFETPDIVEDQLYPQLRKSLSGVVDGLERHEFGVIRSTTLADTDRSVLLIELADTTRPAIERHEGPPVAVRDHAEGFFESYVDDDTVYGPFLDGDRYVVERPREVTDARQYLDSDAIFEVALGAQIETALADDYELLWDEAVATLADAFGTELAAYFEPTP